MKRRKFTFVIDDNGCFVCTSHKRWKGHYPQCRWNGKTSNIHRVIFIECFGEIPKGLDVRHKCDDKGCINPEQMELGTRQDNVNDAMERGLWPLGVNSGNYKLDDEKVTNIRKLLKSSKNKHKTLIELSEKYNTSISTIYAVHYRRSWKQVE